MSQWKPCKRKNSKFWQGRRGNNGKKERKSTGFTKKSDAELCIQQWNTALACPPNAATQAAMLEDAVTTFLESLDGRPDATVSFYEGKCGHLARILGTELMLSELNRPLLEAYIKERTSTHICKSHEGGLNPDAPCRTPICRQAVALTTVKKEMVALRQVLTVAGLPTMTIDQIVPKVKAPYVPKTRWLTYEEAAKLEARIRERFGDAQAAYFCGFLGFGGRKSEMRRARRAHLGEGLLHIDGSKTKSATRDIPITFVMQPWVNKALADAPGRDTLFATWTNLNRDLRLCCQDVGIEPVSPNDLRRTFASWHRHAGMSDEYIALLMGHTSAVMVERVYAQQDGAALLKMMAAFLPQPKPEAAE